MKIFSKYLFITLVAISEMSCGDKTSLDQFPTTINTDAVPVFYVPIAPAITASSVGGFNRPRDLMFGYDGTLYVADFNNNRIVQLDEVGGVIGVSSRIPQPSAMAQTRDMRLLVTVKFGAQDTAYTTPSGVIRTRPGTVGILRLNMIAANGLIANATPELIYIGNQSDTIITLTGIATLASNGFYVSRSGPRNDGFTSPDNAVLNFPPNYVSFSAVNPIINLDAGGFSLASLRFMSSITTFAQPQRNTTALINPNRSFFITSNDTSSNQVFRLRRINYFTDASGDGYAADQTFLLPNKFRSPGDVRIDGETNFIFVVDAKSDSLFQFTAAGVEGVPRLPQQSPGPNNIVSFSRFGVNDKLTAPEGVCPYGGTLYISDTGNNRILRFQLSTDVN
jgi:hypothetical protein